LIDPEALFLADRIARRFSEMLVVATLHLSAVFPATTECVRALMRSATPIVFTAPSGACARSYGGEGDHIRVIGNGVDVVRIPFSRSAAGDRHLIWAGRRSREKGIIEAVEIARRLSRPISIAGAEAPEGPVELDRHGVSVEDLGFVPRSEMGRHFGRASATLVTSSIAESSSLAAMESMAAGTPVVAFRVGALPEVVDEGSTGFLVPAGDVEGAARAAERVTELSRERCRRVAAERFDHARTVAAFESLYSRDPADYGH
jgi:glycosyltransferase involved in cell wall biosynthesis